MGRRDSNPRMTGPKPVALPLGDTPISERGIVEKFHLKKIELASKVRINTTKILKNVVFVALGGCKGDLSLPLKWMYSF